MLRGVRWTAAATLLVVALAGCQKVEEETHKAQASYSVEKVAGSDFKRITLLAKAAERLAIQTVAVREVKTPRGAVRKAIPYGAVVYGTKGETWTYTSPASLTYLRHEIVVDFIDGDRAFLAAGPATGALVVTVGAAELYGLENGFGK